MPNRDSDIYAGQASPLARDRIEGQKVTGDIRYCEAVYTTTTTTPTGEAAGDIFRICQLPIGAIVLPERSFVACEALGGTGTAITKIGDAADDDRYSASSIALTSAAYTALTPAVATGVTTRTPVTKDTNVVQATLALSSGNVTAGRKVVFGIAYRMP